MASYNIFISATAEKVLKKTPKKDRIKIVQLIQTLAISPVPQGARKLMGEQNVYRVRQGNYRVIYELKNKKLIILVLKIGHRKDIYR